MRLVRSLPILVIVAVLTFYVYSAFRLANFALVDGLKPYIEQRFIED